MSAILVRNGPFVDFQIQDQYGGFLVRCDTRYGGTPLWWYRFNESGQTQVVWDLPGAGASVMWDTGQDATQAGATGVDYYPIAILGDPATVKYNYYCKETLFTPKAGNGLPCYQVQGFAPYFWVSQEALDDVVAPDPRGPNRWSTLYQNILNLPTSAYQNFGVPIWFVGNAQVPSGIIMLADEIKKTYEPNTPWKDALCKIPGGHFAVKTRMSMANAGGDSIAGILMRKATPTGNDIHSLFAAPGLHLNITKAGVIQLMRDGVSIWEGLIPDRPKLSTIDGITVEVRTSSTNPNIQIFIDGLLINTLPDTSKGLHFGLFGSGVTGPIKFDMRQFFDTGTQFTATYEATVQNTFRTHLKIERTVLPSVVPTYRTNLPAVFVNHAVQEVIYLYDETGAKRDITWLSKNFGDAYGIFTGLVPANRITGLWAGRRDGKYGVFCKPITFPSAGHALLAPSVLALNALPYSANHTPVELSATTVVADWSPTLRPDIL